MPFLITRGIYSTIRALPEGLEPYFWQHVNFFDRFPRHRSGTALSVYEYHELELLIRQSLGPEIYDQVRRNTQSHLFDTAGAGD